MNTGVTVKHLSFGNDRPEQTVQTRSSRAGKLGRGASATWKHGNMEIGHEIISTATLFLGQLSVTGETMCTKYWLTT